MRRLREWRQSIPRPARIVRNLLLAVVLFLAFYIFEGSPDMNPEQAYRRAAARNLVGPGEVLGILNVDINGGYNRLLLAETEEGVMQFCYRHENLGFFTGHTRSSYEGDLIYREKEGLVTLMAATGHHFSEGRVDAVPLILFDECPNAARAELELRLTGELNGAEYELAYELSAQRENDGYFAFDWKPSEGTDAEDYAMYQVSNLFRESGGSGDSIPATVRLYSRTEELLYEGEAWFRSDADAAHLKREG